MILQLGGIEIPKGFIHPLLKGSRYRLQLPQNWYNHFSGFLMCAAMRRNYKSGQYIRMKHEKGGSTTGIDSEQDMYWKESGVDVETWVGYVSFVSLKDTLWWDPTFTNFEFSLEKEEYEDDSSCSGFGVSLVSKTSKSETTTTTIDSSSQSSNDYKCNFNIMHDSESHFKCLFPFI